MKSAHSHLLSVFAAEFRACASRPSAGPIRILDIGCGYGQFILDLLAGQHALGLGDQELEVYGYEVYDHRAGIPGYQEEVMASLARAEGSVDWHDRIRLGAANEPWPFPDGFFDFALSNQVLEHVEDLGSFFGQLRRVVRKGGGAAHFYPSAETVVEPHSGVPLVHWLAAGKRRNALLWGSRLGLGKFRKYRREQGRGLNAFCDEFEAYLERFVFFRRNSDILTLARSSSDKAGFKYTPALVKRAIADDWECFAYSSEDRFSRSSLLAPFVCSTLVQRF